MLTLLLVRFAYLCPASACTLRGFLVHSLSAILLPMTALISPSSFYLVHIPESPVSPFHLFLGTLITLGHSVAVIVQEFDILPQCLEEREQSWLCLM